MILPSTINFSSIIYGYISTHQLKSLLFNLTYGDTTDSWSNGDFAPLSKAPLPTRPSIPSGLSYLLTIGLTTSLELLLLSLIDNEN